MIRIARRPRSLLALARRRAGAAPGDPGPRFGRRGTVTLKATDADAVGGAVKVLSGNRVLAGGSGRRASSCVVKLRATGSLDSTFGTGGQVVPALPGTSLDGVRAIADVPRRPDRRRRHAAPRRRHHALRGAAAAAERRDRPELRRRARLRARRARRRRARRDGDGPRRQRLSSAAVAAGGAAPFVIRLLPDGTPGPGFGADGTSTAPRSGSPAASRACSSAPDGTLTFTVGAGRPRAATFTVVRLLPTGAPDPTFGGTGIVTRAARPGHRRRDRRRGRPPAARRPRRSSPAPT